MRKKRTQEETKEVCVCVLELPYELGNKQISRTKQRSLLFIRREFRIRTVLSLSTEQSIRECMQTKVI